MADLTGDRHVILIGEMGSGKSTVGRQLAAELDRPYVDSDTRIEEMTGRTAAEIAAQEGVAALHAIELGVFLEMAASSPPAVITPAASVLDDAVARDVLRTNWTFGLHASSAVIEERRRSARHRRPIDAAAMEQLRKRRTPQIEACSRAQLDTEALSVDECVGAILEQLPHPEP
jgi:shikimate kinase